MPNLASIAAQQVGGFVNAGAHGTGALIPPVDDFVLSMTIVTPALGAVTVSRGDVGLQKVVFDMCRVGLGAFGVAAEYTLSCVPAHELVETTTVLTRAEAVESLPSLLKDHRHMRYMWIPYEDAVVVVTNDPLVGENFEAKEAGVQDPLRPLKDLLLANEPSLDTSLVDFMGMGELRDKLLDINPLSTPWIRKVNAAEHEFWKLAQGTRCLPSDKLLQFDCGGQQWVQEVCFPTGSLASPNSNDLSFMLKLLSSLEERDLPAPSPIEQRWTASSTSSMSPANTTKNPADTVYSWIGIIMYLTSDDPKKRGAVTDRFQNEYRDVLEAVGDEYKAVTHWAKQVRELARRTLAPLCWCSFATSLRF